MAQPGYSENRDGGKRVENQEAKKPAESREDAVLTAKALDKRIGAAAQTIEDLRAGNDPRLAEKKKQIQEENRMVPTDMRARMSQLGAEALTQYHQELIGQAEQYLAKLKKERGALGVPESN